MDSSGPLSVAPTVAQKRGVDSIDDVRVIQRLNVAAVHEALDDMHRNVAASLDETRRGAVQ